MLIKIWLYPPMAIARVGSSLTPCANFHWTESDIWPDGTGKTTLTPAETLSVDPVTGTISADTPSEILFKDATGIRPVCPFFELHGTWEEHGATHSGPITPALLHHFGVRVSDVTWTVELANLKPHHYTLQDSDRIEAVETVAGDDTAPRPLMGRSPSVPRSLIFPGQGLRLGAVQLTRPGGLFPELRLRFTPPAGRIYGPRNLKARLAQLRFSHETDPQLNTLLQDNREWQGFTLPEEQLILAENAAWATFALATQSPIGPQFGDVRTSPGQLFAWVHEPPRLYASLGLSDDISDGIIRCQMPGVGQAIARIVVGPPDFAPDRRHVVSLADGLADREDRSRVRQADFLNDPSAITEIVQDLMERAFETSGLMNIDAQNDRSRRSNLGSWDPATSPFTREEIERLTWSAVELSQFQSTPLSHAGRQRHHRNAALEVFEDRLRENPRLLEQWIRPPLAPNPFWDRRMPAGMRGSDGRPMHLTRRQYDLLRVWAQKLHDAGEPNA